MICKYLIIKKEMIVKNDTDISSFLWGADGVIHDRHFLKDWFG